MKKRFNIFVINNFAAFALKIIMTFACKQHKMIKIGFVLIVLVNAAV